MAFLAAVDWNMVAVFMQSGDSTKTGSMGERRGCCCVGGENLSQWQESHLSCVEVLAEIPAYLPNQRPCFDPATAF